MRTRLWSGRFKNLRSADDDRAKTAGIVPTEVRKTFVFLLYHTANNRISSPFDLAR